MLRFANWQESKGKCRLIDNGRSSGHSDQHDALERTHTSSVEAGTAVAQRLLSYMDSQGIVLEGILRGISELRKAYRQTPVHPHHLRFHVVGAWHPERHECFFCCASRFMFWLGSGSLAV